MAIKRLSTEQKAEWLNGRVNEVGTWNEGVVITFDMPSVTLKDPEHTDDKKYHAIRCSCRHHVVKHGGKVTKENHCQYTKAAEAAYKLP